MALPLLSRARAPRAALLLLVLAAAVLGLPGLTPAAAAADPLISQGKPATASGTENAAFPASAAVDGDPGTRWSSAFSDPQWIQVDLGATASVCQVVLQWEAAFARSFQIQVAPAATGPFTTVFATTTGTGGTQTLAVSGSGRFVRMNGTARAARRTRCSPPSTRPRTTAAAGSARRSRSPVTPPPRSTRTGWTGTPRT
jgi:F5/8 type C domain